MIPHLKGFQRSSCFPAKGEQLLFLALRSNLNQNLGYIPLLSVKVPGNIPIFCEKHDSSPIWNELAGNTLQKWGFSFAISHGKMKERNGKRLGSPRGKAGKAGNDRDRKERRPSMDEKDFELLEALDETRNITHAADKLYMTQSALSKRIKSMEQELGVEILLRSRQGIRFTPAGEKVLERSRAALRQMEQLRRELDAMQGEACGTLKAGVSVNFSYYKLPDVLTEYHKRYPRVRLDIATGHSRHLYQQMLDGELDIAVLRGEYPWDGTQFLLSQENICLVYAKEYQGKPLSEYLYIDHRTDSSLGAQMARWRYENGVTSDAGSFVVDNITACLEMVKRGLGWSLMPEVALEGFDGCIEPCIFENGEPFVRRTYIFCQRDAVALPQVQLFMEMLKKRK